jgi:hypothetical protein
MPALDLALGLRMKPFCQFAGDVAGSVVAEQARLWTTRALSQPGAIKASVFVASSVFIVVHSFQAMM